MDFFEYLLEEALVYSVEEAFEKVVVALIFYLMVFLMEESYLVLRGNLVVLFFVDYFHPY